MYKKEITYTDYNDNTRTESFYFNLNKKELAALELSQKGGFEAYINYIVNAESGEEIMATLEKIILMSYGVKSVDGKSFMKTPEVTDEFKYSEAYAELFMELVTDADKAAEFVNAIIPSDIRDQVSNISGAANVNVKNT